MTVTNLFVNVILPRPIPIPLTYSIPHEICDSVFIGSRLLLPFGKSKFTTGIVVGISNEMPKHSVKVIIEVLDQTPIVNSIQIEFFNWMASYYMCTIGEVYRMALPSGFKLNSESQIQLNPNFNLTLIDSLSANEQSIISLLQNKSSLSYKEAADAIDKKSVCSIVKTLLNKQAILIFEQVKDRYSPKRAKVIMLHEEYILHDEKLKTLFARIKKRSKQLDVLLKYISQVSTKFQSYISMNDFFVDKKSFAQNDISPSALNSMIKSGIFLEKEVIVPRFQSASNNLKELPVLSQPQSTAYQQINNLFEKKQTVLLHGITGSGKTEIYIHLIKNALANGGQVLYLLPEIAITTQIVSRLKIFFGSNMAVYHSKYSDNERVEVWRGILNGQFQFVLGVRSSIFLPFDNLKLIIVDEEHEISYKQFESTPRYHARDSAIMLSHYHNAKVLLGSATPAIETYYNVKSEKFGLVNLQERFGESSLPEIIIANTKLERECKTIKNDFTKKLLDELNLTMQANEQAMIFQNIRGYAPYITCIGCAWVPTCTQCSVSLTYHQSRNLLCCHYCSYSMPVPSSCSICNAAIFKNIGFGTEKLEESLNLFFPQKIVKRIDLDTTRSKNGYDNLINSIELGTTDIIVGTQMIIKGLDFDNLTFVGVMNADKLIYMPDFRAYERCFHIITQIAGRAGRRVKKGKVIIQTSNPSHKIIESIVQSDYTGMYLNELKERKEYSYPPYVRLIKISLKHENEDLVNLAAKTLFEHLRSKLGKYVLGPQTPAINKIRLKYIMDIWAKIHNMTSDNLILTKKFLLNSLQVLHKEPKFRPVRIIFDVDPM